MFIRIYYAQASSTYTTGPRSVVPAYGASRKAALSIPGVTAGHRGSPHPELSRLSQSHRAELGSRLC